jgi:hypothetical protein
MALDFDKIRQEYARLNGEKQESDSGSGKFLRIQDGETTVRILPGKDDDTLFYAATALHYVPQAEGKSKVYTCNKVHGGRCPLCDAYYAAWKMVDAGEIERDQARKLKPTKTYYYNVYDRESGEVKVLRVGIKLHTKVIETIMDDDYGDVTDLESGHDFKIVKAKDGPWTNYDKSSFRPKSTPAGINRDVAAWMEGLHDIHGLVTTDDFGALQQAAETYFISIQGGVPAGGSPRAEETTSQEAPSRPVDSEEDFLRRLNQDD